MKVLHTAPSRDPRPEVRVPAGRLPRWDRVLAVVAHPDDESFGLGAVLAAVVGEGAEVGVLCLTHGEASTLTGSTGTCEPSARVSWPRRRGCSARGGRGCTTTPTAR
jgi:hypothetical protein